MSVDISDCLGDIGLVFLSIPNDTVFHAWRNPKNTAYFHVPLQEEKYTPAYENPSCEIRFYSAFGARLLAGCSNAMRVGLIDTGSGEYYESPGGGMANVSILSDEDGQPLPRMNALDLLKCVRKYLSSFSLRAADASF